MFPPSTAGWAGSRGEERVGERRRRRLALRAGHADVGPGRGAGTGPASETSAGARGPEAARDSTSVCERSSEPRFGRRVVGIDRGRRRHEGRAVPGRRRVDLRAERDRTGRPSTGYLPIGTRFVPLSNTGHFVHIEQPEICANLILDLLAS